MQSNKSKLIDTGMKLLGFKRLIYLFAKFPIKINLNIIHSYLLKDLKVISQTILGFEIKTLLPKNQSSKHIIYLHGGAYTFGLNYLHWNFIKKIFKATDTKITVIDYPLTPKHNYKDTFEFLKSAYNSITTSFPDDKFIFLGDSAGGGLALSFTQLLLQDKLSPLPKQLILISPWLDLSLQNPQIQHYEKLDQQLSVPFLNYCAKHYSGSTNKTNFLLSPIYGEIKKVPPTHIFFSSSELFYPDISKLEKLSIENFHYYMFEGVQHDWVLLPIPESKLGLDKTVSIIKTEITA